MFYVWANFFGDTNTGIKPSYNWGNIDRDLADNGRKIKFGTPTSIMKLAVNAH